MKKKMYLKRTLAVSVLIFVLLLSACGGVPAGNPSVSINMKSDGLAAGDVTVTVDVKDFDTSTGNIIYYMDTSVPTYYDHSATSKAGTYAVSGETSHTFSGVTPGEHTFSVQLVKANNTPLPVPVVDKLTVNVGAPQGKPAVKIMTPQDGSAPAPGNIVFALNVENFMISKQDMGVVNREGEGHLIYYIGEQPPTDPGVPALTETSVVSTDLKFIWKGVKEGTHTLYVQLVNNDDTPLESPVTASVTIQVTP